MMSGRLGSNSPKSFNAYPRAEIDIESGLRNLRRVRSLEVKPTRMIKSVANRLKYYLKLHPLLVFLLSLLFGIAIVVLFLLYDSPIWRMSSYRMKPGFYPFPKLKNLVMVAGHSVYTSSDCGEVGNEDSWFLESYQKHPGQAATFVAHIKEGVEVAARDGEALLLFSGGETRKDAGPRSEAQSYWLVAEAKGWFGESNVRGRALTEEHARDSFENLLFSVCRFRELTGMYPQNITVGHLCLWRSDSKGGCS